MNTLTFNCGEVIFKQGDYASSMYDIVSGQIGIYSAYGTDQEKQITVLSADEVLGEMGMIEVYPRSATAVALEDGTVLAEITESELSDYFRSKPEKLLKIMKILAKRIRETNTKYVNACRVVYENAEAENSGSEKSEWLKDQIIELCAEFGQSAF